MDSPIRLHIRFDGTAPGLKEHRLSLVAFGESLQHLLNALRRAADRELQSGSSNKDGTRQFGKYGKEIDLQLAAIKDGCVQMEFECDFPNAPQLAQGQNSVAERALSRVLRNIQLATQSKDSASRDIRKFFDALPAGVQAQEYKGLNASGVFASVSVGDMSAVAPRPSALPVLLDAIARVTGFGFGKHETVRVRTTEGEIYTCLADADLLDRAFRLRQEMVVVKILNGNDFRQLLSIRPTTEKPPEYSIEHRLDVMVAKWNVLLHRLAQ